MDKEQLLERIRELMDQHHKKMDGVTTSPELKAKSEGYIEALYHLENLIINWGSNGN